MPTAGNSDYRAMLEFQMNFGICLPECKSLFTARNSRNSHVITRAAETKVQRLIAEPIMKIRTAATKAKNMTNEMTPMIRFLSLLNVSRQNAVDLSSNR